MRVGQGVRSGLGHGGITCVLQTQFFSFYYSTVVKCKYCSLVVFFFIFC